MLNQETPSYLSGFETEISLNSTLETRSTDFGEFKEAVEFCYKAMKTGKFTSSQGYAYLTLYGINRKWQSHIIIKAENDHLFAELVRLNLVKVHLSTTQ